VTGANSFELIGGVVRSYQLQWVLSCWPTQRDKILARPALADPHLAMVSPKVGFDVKVNQQTNPRDAAWLQVSASCNLEVWLTALPIVKGHFLAGIIIINGRPAAMIHDVGAAAP
jgi:hypothetical protein